MGGVFSGKYWYASGTAVLMCDILQGRMDKLGVGICRDETHMSTPFFLTG